MGGDNGARRPGLVESLFNELRSAFQDVRQKVIEEGWFGRVVSAAPVVEMDHARERGGLYGDDHRPTLDGHAPEPGQRASFEDQWAARDPSAQPADHAHEQDIGMDR